VGEVERCYILLNKGEMMLMAFSYDIAAEMRLHQRQYQAFGGQKTCDLCPKGQKCLR
jgi:hypothetical protein